MKRLITFVLLAHTVLCQGFFGFGEQPQTKQDPQHAATLLEAMLKNHTAFPALNPQVYSEVILDKEDRKKAAIISQTLTSLEKTKFLKKLINTDAIEKLFSEKNFPNEKERIRAKKNYLTKILRPSLESLLIKTLQQDNIPLTLQLAFSQILLRNEYQRVNKEHYFLNLVIGTTGLEFDRKGPSVFAPHEQAY